MPAEVLTKEGGGDESSPPAWPKPLRRGGGPRKSEIAAPPLEIQKQLVAEAEKEEEIIASNRRLIDLMERKIEKVLAEI